MAQDRFQQSRLQVLVKTRFIVCRKLADNTWPGQFFLVCRKQLTRFGAGMRGAPLRYKRSCLLPPGQSAHNRVTTSLPAVLAKRKRVKGKLGAYVLNCVAAGAHLPTPWLFEPAKRPDDRADYCLYCCFLHLTERNGRSR